MLTACYLTINQRIVHQLISYPATHLLQLAFNIAVLKSFREFGDLEHKPPVLLVLALLQLKLHFPSPHPVSVDWLYCTRASGPKFRSVTLGSPRLPLSLCPTDCHLLLQSLVAAKIEMKFPSPENKEKKGNSEQAREET